MNFTHSTILHSLAIALLVALMTPGRAGAVPPPAVTGLAGAARGREIVLTWDPSPDPSVTSYNVYYSSQSILENAGLYDDFENTGSPAATFALPVPNLSAEEIFIAVLAVNGLDEEGAAFDDEIAIGLTGANAGKPAYIAPGDAVPEGMTAEPPQMFATDGALHLLSAQALSPTQILLTFSNPIEIAPAYAPQAFRIVDARGVLLPIRSMLIDQERAAADTETQTRGAVYEVRLSEPLAGVPSLPLDATDRSAFFAGHPDGLTESPAQPPAQQQQQTPVPAQQPPSTPPITVPSQPACPRDPYAVPDVQNFTMAHEPQTDGSYTVTARWTADNSCGDLIGFVALQTRDRGLSFGPPELLPIDIAGAILRGVTPGEFGLALYAINQYGFVSQNGAFGNLSLPFTAGSNFTYPFGGAISIEYIPLADGNVRWEVIPDSPPQAGTGATETPQGPFPVTIAEPAAAPHAAAPSRTKIDPTRLAVVLVSGFALVLAATGATVWTKKAVRKT